MSTHLVKLFKTRTVCTSFPDRNILLYSIISQCQCSAKTNKAHVIKFLAFASPCQLPEISMTSLYHLLTVSLTVAIILTSFCHHLATIPYHLFTIHLHHLLTISLAILKTDTLLFCNLPSCHF